MNMSSVLSVLLVRCVQYLLEGMPDSGMSLKLRKKKVGSKIVISGDYWQKEAI